MPCEAGLTCSNTRSVFGYSIGPKAGPYLKALTRNAFAVVIPRRCALEGAVLMLNLHTIDFMRVSYTVRALLMGVMKCTTCCTMPLMRVRV